MSEFDLSGPDDYDRCKKSLDEQNKITLSVVGRAGTAKTYNGIVHAIKKDENTGRWHVTMLDRPLAKE
jgi:hypothetical protein